jgi:serine/threonine-protein kinase
VLEALRPLVGRLRDPLDAALSREILRLEIMVARASQALYLGFFFVSIGFALTVSAHLGLLFAVACASYLAWYSLLARAYGRSGGGTALRVAATVVDSTAPWVFALGLLFAQGATYALSSWIPPFLYCALLVGAVVRLRPVTALVFGLSSGLLFPLFYFVLAHGRLRGAEAQSIVYQPTLQWLRTILLVLAGVLAALVTGGLRRVVGRAEGAVREADLFGKYRLVRKIASGGMGEVFEALYCPEGGFQRRVAVKRIHGHLAEQRRFVEAFRAEAELTSRLAHPSLVQVMDFGRIGPTYFLAMEYVDGVTLGALFGRLVASGERWSPGLVAHVGRELLEGLAYAHQSARGDDGQPLRVIHRDVCPSNVLVSRSGAVKLADFGVARALRDASTAQTRSVHGHVGYLAPEQASAAPVDERADLFAVGVLLWELLAGHHLFLLDSDAASLMALTSREVLPISALRPDVGAGWDAFFGRAIARDPSGRYETAREMLRALDELPGARDERAAERLAVLVSEVTVAGGPPD